VYGLEENSCLFFFFYQEVINNHCGIRQRSRTETLTKQQHTKNFMVKSLNHKKN
jgi:hypothetical protein